MNRPDLDRPDLDRRDPDRAGPSRPGHTRRRHLQHTGGALAALAALGCGLPQPARAWGRPRTLDLVPARSVTWADFLGVNAQLQYVSAEVARRQVAAFKKLGLRWLRLGLHWMLIEPRAGRWELADVDRMMALVQAEGLHSITSVVGTPRFLSSAPAGDRHFDKYPPADPKAYAQRLMLLAQRYPQVDVWQVWNEPNIPGFWLPKADPQGYARLLAPAVMALRSKQPDRPVAMAGMAYYSQMYGRSGLMLEDMGKLGAYGLNLIVAYHPYTAEPEGADDGSRDFLTHAPFIHKWLRAAGVQQIWATEWGWSSYAGPKEEQPIIGEDGQADYTLRRLALMAALDYDKVFLFALGDLDERAGPRDRRYGLLRENGEPKPVYHALSRFLALTGPRLAPGSAPSVEGGLPKGLVSIGWKREDGQRLWMVWADEPTTLKLPGLTRATLHDPLTGRQTALVGDRGISVPVTRTLQMLAY